MDPQTKQESAKPLEVRTRTRLVRLPDQLDHLSTADIQSLVLELAVHQKELEAQNEELRATEVELELARRRYSDLFLSAPVGYVLLDRSSRIVEINEAAQKLLGPLMRTFAGQPFGQFVANADLLRFRDHCAQAAETRKTETCELRLKRADGTFADVQMVTVATLADGEGLEDSLRISLIDITYRKESDEHLRRLNDHLNRTASELLSANREVEAFSHSITHDLQQPLRTIQGFGDLLAQGYAAELDNIGRDYILKIRTAAKRMDELINDLLHLARLGLAPFTHGTVNLSEVAEKAISEQRHADPEREVEVVIAEDLTCQGDQRLLDVAVSHLITNAWKFSQKAAKPRIEFNSVQRGGYRTYYVRDNGVGFDMRDASRLFQPFQRLHSPSEYPGSGVGLAMVARIIRRHGGSIHAEAEPGKGATFFFTLGS